MSCEIIQFSITFSISKVPILSRLWCKARDPWWASCVCHSTIYMLSSVANPAVSQCCCRDGSPHRAGFLRGVCVWGRYGAVKINGCRSEDQGWRVFTLQTFPEFLSPFEDSAKIGRTSRVQTMVIPKQWSICFIGNWSYVVVFGLKTARLMFHTICNLNVLWNKWYTGTDWKIDACDFISIIKDTRQYDSTVQRACN